MNRACILILSFACGSFTPSCLLFSQEQRTDTTQPLPTLSPEKLAEEVRRINLGKALSTAKKEKQIASAVRVAVVAATAYQSDSARALQTAVAYAEAAAAAAPRFADVIAQSSSFAPAVSRVAGGAAELKIAVFAAARGAGKPPSGKPAVSTQAIASSSRPPTEVTPVASRAAAETPKPTVDPLPTGVYRRDPEPTPANRLPALTESQKFSLTASASVSFDDNVYLTKDNKESDEIIVLAPGVRYEFGHNSLINGFASYELQITEYLSDSAPQSNLSNFDSNVSYTDVGLKLTGGAAYSQSNQNSRELAGLATRTLYTTESLVLRSNAEYEATPLIGLGAGASYAWTDYDTTDLVGNKNLSIPLNVYFKATPKVDYSAGVAYSTTKPDSGPGSATDFYYNVGARGAFTPKLSGSVSVGYRTRAIKDGPDDSQLGYDGALSYELTPKTGLQLSFNRSFRTSPIGTSQDNTSFFIGATSAISPQFDASVGLSYQQVEYGLQVFAATPGSSTASRRADDYWDANLKFDYIFNSWLNFSLSYLHRTNESNLLGQDFSNNIFTLFSGFRF